MKPEYVANKKRVINITEELKILTNVLSVSLT